MIFGAGRSTVQNGRHVMHGKARVPPMIAERMIFKSQFVEKFGKNSFQPVMCAFWVTLHILVLQMQNAA
jgi:hypothetical protein